MALLYSIGPPASSGEEISAGLASLALSELPAAINAQTAVSANLGALALAPAQASVGFSSYLVQANLATLELTRYSASTGLTPWESVRGAGNYGILVPYPTEAVPSAIMTGQSTGAPTGADYDDHEWIGTYDPCTVATPTATPAGDSDEWYISSSGDDGTAGQSGQGTSSAPRRTMPPSGSYGAGTKFFIDGTGTFGSGSGDSRNYLFNGTSSNQCWVVYVGTNTWADIDIQNITWRGTHFLVDALDFDLSSNANTSHIIGSGTATEYVAFRDCRWHADGTDVGNDIGVNIDAGAGGDPVDFVLLLRPTVENLGEWSSPGDENDYHGIRPFRYVRHLWIVDYYCRGCGGDGMQVANSSAQWGSELNTAAARPHYVYVLGGDMSQFGEQAIDSKNCFHLLIEDLYGHDNTTVRTGGGSPNSINLNNDEGPLDNYKFCYRCTFENDQVSMLDQADQADTISGAIACVFDGSSSGWMPAGNASHNPGDKLKYCVDCTFGNCTNYGIDENYSGSGADGHALVHGVCLVNNAGEYFKDSTTEYREIVNALAYRSGGSASLSSSGFDVYTNVTLDEDPLLTDPDNGDFTIASGSSPLIGQNSEHSIYQLIEDMYGKDIRYDKAGVARGASWDIGAYQYAG